MATIDRGVPTFAAYPFGLSEGEEQRARELHDRSVIVDLLYWGPTGPETFPPELEPALRDDWERRHNPLALYATAARSLVQAHVDGADGGAYLDNWEASGVTAGTRSVEVGFPEVALEWFATVQSTFDRLPWLVKVQRAADIRAAKREGKRAGIVNTQLISGPGTNLLANLPVYHQLGLRILMLTYNSQNALGAGCTERHDAGLSRLGEQVVAEMNRVGILVDTAHCGPRTTLDACAASSAPVVASHAVAGAVYDHARGKSDEELRAIAATGGVIGVAMVPAFLSPTEPATIDLALDHLDYIARLVGWQHVALGTDWPLPLPASLNRAVGEAAVGGTFRPEDDMDFDRHTTGFEDCRDYPNITRGLVKRDYTDEQIAGILGENALRAIEGACG